MMSSNTLNEATNLLQKAAESTQNNSYQNAANICKALNNQYPDFADGWYMASLLAVQINNLQLSLDTINKAIILSPTNYPWILHKIHVLHHSGAPLKAIELAIHTSQSEIDDARILEELALFLSKNSCIKEAKRLYQKALLLTPKVGRLHYNLAVMQNFLGETEAAEHSCDRAIAINKYDSNAHFLRSSLSKQQPSKNHIAELDGLLNEIMNNPTDRAQIYFALAKEYEDCKEYTSSFKTREEGAILYRKNMDYDFRSDILFIDEIIETYDHKIHSQPENCLKTKNLSSSRAQIFWFNS